MKLPPLTALHYFVVAAKHLSFSKAAEELCVTEGAVSRQMKLLAEFYQKPLFLKKGRGVVLSNNGSQLLSVVLPAYTQVSDITAKLLKDESQLTVLVTTSFAIRWLLPKLTAFETSYPEFPVQIQASTSKQSMEGKVFDIQIQYYLKPVSYPSINQVKLFDEWLLAVCSPNYLLENNNQAKPFRVEDLYSKRLLLNEMTGRDWILWAEMLNLPTLPISNALKFEQDDVAIQAAVAGHGIALANTAYIQRELSLGSLVPATDQTEIIVGAHYLHLNNDRANSLAVKAFKQWLLDQVK